jgi:hypothetical protein
MSYFKIWHFLFILESAAGNQILRTIFHIYTSLIWGWTTGWFGSVRSQNLKPAQSTGGEMQSNSDCIWALVQAGSGQLGHGSNEWFFMGFAFFFCLPAIFSYNSPTFFSYNSPKFFPFFLGPKLSKLSLFWCHFFSSLFLLFFLSFIFLLDIFFVQYKL